MTTLRQRLAAILGALVLAFLLIGALVAGSIVYGAQQPSGAVQISLGQGVLAAGVHRIWDCRDHLLHSTDCPPVYGVWLSAPTANGRVTTTMLLDIPESIVVIFRGRQIAF